MLLVFAVASSACQIGGEGMMGDNPPVASPMGQPVRIVEDVSVQPSRTELEGKVIPGTNRLSGPRPLAALMDSSGKKSTFVTNELIVWATSEAAAREAATSLGGELIASTPLTTTVPNANARTLNLRREDPYLVQIPEARLADTTDGHLTGFEARMQSILDAWEPRLLAARGRGAKGAHYASHRAANREVRISSLAATRILALAAQRLEQGMAISVNFVASPAGVMNTTNEQPITTNLVPGPDSLTWPENAAVPRDASRTRTPIASTNAGSGTNVAMAWQLLAADNLPQRIASRQQAPVMIAILDGGFNLMTDGTRRQITDPSRNPLNPTADLPGPRVPVQFDYASGDSDASGPNPAGCGNNPCISHGGATSSAAVGGVDNGVGASGSGGMVGVPALYRIDLSDRDVMSGIRQAQFGGADIINMSFGGSCDTVFCNLWHAAGGYYQTFTEAAETGGVLIAAAGNQRFDTDDQDYHPCVIDEVICVGSLNTGDQIRARAFSNFGPAVDIWAPGTIYTMPGANGLTTTITATSGTSLSSPFIAGIVAMLRAAQPGITPAAVKALLQSTAWPAVREVAIPASVDSNGNPVAAIGATVEASGAPIYTHPVDAYSALLEALHNRITPDAFDAASRNDTAETATPINVRTQYDNLNLDSAADQDHYVFQIDDYRAIQVVVNSMASLGNVQLFLQPVGGGRLTNLNRVVSGNISRITVSEAAPGRYHLLVSGNAPNGYDLRIDASPIGLLPDAYEENDHLRSDLPSFVGGSRLTLHVDTDVDYYRIHPTVRTAFNFYQVALTACDRPIDWTVVDERDVAVSATQHCVPGERTSPIALEGEAVDNPARYIRVVPAGPPGARTTRYMLRAETIVDSSRFDPSRLHVERTTFIDFDLPQPFWTGVVSEATGVLAFTLKPGSNEIPTLRLIANGLHATVLGIDLHILTTGSPIMTTGMGNGLLMGEMISHVSVPPSTQDQLFLIQLTRTDPTPMSDDTLPEIEFRLERLGQ